MVIRMDKSEDFIKSGKKLIREYDGANLKGIRLYREMPDKGEKLVHNINFQDFIDTGNRSNFIKIKPNDTIIIPQKTSHLILKQVGTINTIFSAVMIYLQIRYLANSQ